MPVKGYHRSEETKRKISLGNLGKKRSAETIAKLRFNNLGKKMSAESSMKKSLKLSGELNPMYGKTHTPEAREKIRLARAKYTGVNHPFYGKHHKPESIAKVSKENCYMWKGDDISYRTLHVYIRKYLPKSKQCLNCGLETKLDVANMTGIYNRELHNWKWLCRRCHMIFDGNIRNLKQYQHKK